MASRKKVVRICITFVALLVLREVKTKEQISFGFLSKIANVGKKAKITFFYTTDKHYICLYLKNFQL